MPSAGCQNVAPSPVTVNDSVECSASTGCCCVFSCRPSKYMQLCPASTKRVASGVLVLQICSSILFCVKHWHTIATQSLHHLPQQPREQSTQFSRFDERHMSNLVIVAKLPMASLPGRHTDRQHAVPSPANRACGKPDLTCGVEYLRHVAIRSCHLRGLVEFLK